MRESCRRHPFLLSSFWIFLFVWWSPVNGFAPHQFKLHRSPNCRVMNHERRSHWRMVGDLVPTIATISNSPVESKEWHYIIAYPDDFKETKKPVKTHKFESVFSSTKNKGFTVGITVDPVKINSLLGYTTPQKLGDRVLAVEKGKEGFIDGEIISTTSSDLCFVSSESIPENCIPYYDLDYRIETTRGNNHFFVRTWILNKLLYVLTIQTKESAYSSLYFMISDILKSLQLI